MNILETNRLILRTQTEDDVEDLFAILSDPETMRFYPRPYTRGEVKGWIDNNLKRYCEDGFGLWAVMLKEGGQCIGQCGITRLTIDGESVPEIGYHINKAYWNKGYATEAARACLEYGFGRLNLERIYIHTYIKNTPSIRVAKKLGMPEIKKYDKVCGPEKLIMEHVVFALDRDAAQAHGRG